MSDPMRFSQRRRLLPDEAIVALYADLQDSDAVAIRAGCSAPTVLALVRRAGQPVRPSGPRRGRRTPLAVDDAEIIRRYLAGQYAREISRDVGCSETMVYRLLKSAGIPRRRHVPPREP